MRYAVLFAVALVAALPLSAKEKTAPPPIPANQVLAAAIDLLKLPPEVQTSTRYLDLGNMGQHVEKARKVMFGHVQHLSRDPRRELPYVVPHTNGALLRIDLRDYAIKFATWELLEKVDPYFHLQKFDPKTKTREIQPAPLLDMLAPHLEAQDTLQKLTHSRVPIVNASWFFNQTAAQENRIPGYYDFVGVVTLEDFWDAIGFDPKKAKLFGDEIRASIGVSGVSRQPRAVARFAAAGGGYWFTLDFKLAVGEANPIRNQNRKTLEALFDATELYGVLPNRFFITGLFDSQAKRQDFAPGFVGRDYLSKSKDGNIHVNVSCYRCHKNGGLQGLRDWTRSQLSWPQVGQFWPKEKFQTYDEYRDFRRQHLRPLEPLLNEDRLRYETAVKEVTGWDAKTYAENYGWLWEWTEDAQIDLDRAAADLGVLPAKLGAAFKAAGLPPLGGLDPALAGLIAEGEQAEKLGYRQWLEVLPIAREIYVRFAK